jgi:YVTN family beta-propeller protein
VATVGVGNFPIGVAIAPDGAIAYVTNRKIRTVSVIETASNTVVATVNLG